MGRREVLGLEVREDLVRVVSVRLQRQPVATAYGHSEVASGDDSHALAQEALAKALKEPSEGRFTTRDAYLSVPESGVFRKIVEVPAEVPAEDLRAKINEAISGFLPGEPDSMEVDYQIIPQAFFAKPDASVRHAAVVAVEKRAVQDLVALAAALRLTPRAVDTVPAALARAVLAPNDADPAFVIAAEAGQITIILCQGGLVWATGVVRGNAAEDPAGLAVSVADEVAHIGKFYANRSGVSKLPKRVLLASSFPSEFKKKLSDEVDGTVKEAKPLIPLSAGLDGVVALGTALYPLYQLLPERK